MSEIRQIPFGRPWITDDDRRAVLGVLDGPILTHGPHGQAFEAEFGATLGDGGHAVSVSSCMAALHLAYLALGIGSGDEVLAPAMTHTATVNAIEWVGARPIFVDCDPATGNIAPESIGPKVTPRTRALAVVHFVGIPCDMPRLMALAERHGLHVIEDCALALGARCQGKHVGLFGDAGCFSFYPVKHITTGEGGMFVSRHAALAARVARLRAFSVDRTFSERTIPGMYDVSDLGLNYRMSEMQAALGRGQLSRLSEILQRRQDNFRALACGLAPLPNVTVLDAPTPDLSNSHYCLTVALGGRLAERRDEIVRRVNARGVGTSIHYPHPVPRMSYYRGKYGYTEADYPAAADISDHSFALPVAPHVTREDVQYMLRAVSQVLGELTS